MKLNVFKLERYFAQHEFTAEYMLSSSDCDGVTVKHILKGASSSDLALWNNLQLGYTESRGNPLLREAISQFYEIDSIEKIVVASPGELNFAAMNVLLEDKDHVVSVSPCYQSLREVVEAIGCELSFWEPNPEDWTFKVEDIENLITDRTKLIILNFPHNPTGSYLSATQIEKIVQVARSKGIYIFSDEMYSKLMVGEAKEVPPINDLYERGISLWGTSKTLGMAGLRMGWLVSQDQAFIDGVVAFKDYLSICSSAPSEILSLMALKNFDRFLLPNLRKIKANIKLFSAFADQQPIISQFIPPQAGSTSFVNLDIEETSLTFSDRLVREAGVLSIPAEMFDYAGKYIRVGFGRENFPMTLNVLSEYLHSAAVNPNLIF